MKSQQRTQKVTVITEKACVFWVEPGDRNRKRREGQGLWSAKVCLGRVKGGSGGVGTLGRGSLPSIKTLTTHPHTLSQSVGLFHTRCQSSPQPFRIGHAITLFVLWLKKWQVRN